jgi:hypothetical protein
MASLEKEKREDLELEIAWEKREKKILLICSAVCCGLGLIIGVVAGISNGDLGSALLGGIWIGTGIGSSISYIPEISRDFKKAMKGEGFGEALKTAFIGILVWFFIFGVIGPIGLLIRVSIKNNKIKKLEKRLSTAGQ